MVQILGYVCLGIYGRLRKHRDVRRVMISWV